MFALWFPLFEQFITASKRSECLEQDFFVSQKGVHVFLAVLHDKDKDPPHLEQSRWTVRARWEMTINTLVY